MSARARSSNPPHLEVYQRNISFLMRCLQIDEVLTYMLSNQAITQRQYEGTARRIRHDGPTSASEYFVTEVLIRDPDPYHFAKFLMVLDKTNQTAIARKLKKDWEAKTGETFPYRHEVTQNQIAPDPAPMLRQPIHPTPGEPHTPVTAPHTVPPAPQTVPPAPHTVPPAPHAYTTVQGKQIEHMDMALAAADSETRRIPQPLPDLPDMLADLQPIGAGSLSIYNNIRLGRGAYGMVYKGNLSGTEVAVKEITMPLKQTNFTKEVINEIKVSNLVRHPNIVKFMGYMLTKEHKDRLLLMAFEFIDGADLDHIMNDEELYNIYQMFETRNKYRVLCDVSKALAYLHGQQSPIVHGDIKPANVMITKNGEVKLCDLGLSKIKRDPSLTMTTTMAARGTPVYMAPEQLLASKTSSPSTDIYAFGTMMFEVLFEEPLRDEDSKEKLEQTLRNEEFPQKLLGREQEPGFGIVADCVVVQPEQRPKALTIVEDLKNICQTLQNT